MSFKISTFGLGNSGINGGLDFVDRHFGQSHPFTGKEYSQFRDLIMTNQSLRAVKEYFTINPNASM